MDDINPRVLIGGFYNLQLASKLRLTNKLVFGGGNQHHGLRWSSDLAYSPDDFAAHHNVSIFAGLSVVNQAYNQAFFGVSHAESLRSFNRSFTDRLVSKISTLMCIELGAELDLVAELILEFYTSERQRCC